MKIPPLPFPFLTSAKKIEPLIDLFNQSLLLDNDKSQRQSQIIKDDGQCEAHFSNDVKTILDVIYSGLQLSVSEECIGERDYYSNKYRWLTYHELTSRMRSFGSGLVNIGLATNSSSKIGIYGVNCSQWVIAEFAAFHYSMAIVPMYEALGPEDCTYIINQVGIETIVVDKLDRIRQLLTSIQTTPSLKHIIFMFDGIDDSNIELANMKGIELHTFRDIENSGRDSYHDIVRPGVDDLAEICFTSGTTDNPKGVMLTHGNYIAALSGIIVHLKPFINLSQQTLLSFIPLAHTLGFLAELAMYAFGGRVAIYGGDCRGLVRDLQDVHPTMLVVMPKFLTNVYNRICYSVKGNFFKSKLMELAITTKENEFHDY